jgi:hypothetical protein
MSLFDNWTEEHGSPQVEEDSSGATITHSYFANWADVWAGLPEQRSSYPHSDIIGTNRYNDLILSNNSIVSMDGGERARISLIYRPKEVASGSGMSFGRQEAETVSTMTIGTIEAPIEKASGYKTKWNYDLYAKTSGASTPGWWTTATDRSDADGSTYLWSKINPGNSYYKIEDRTKPGRESYFIPAPIAQDRTSYKSQTSANTAASTAGSIGTPTNKFGLTTGTWLVVSTNIYFEDRMWIVEKEYQHDPNTWDTDLYS